MAKANNDIVMVLRKTAKELSKASTYQWGHMGSCNCGFLAQQITLMSSKEIHSKAMQKHGDWNEQLNDYCPTSGLLMDDLISEMLDFGFDSEDLKHLEKLSDKKILQCLPIEERYLQHNIKKDVIKYLETWAFMLEETMIEKIKLPVINQQKVNEKLSSFAEV